MRVAKIAAAGPMRLAIGTSRCAGRPNRRIVIEPIEGVAAWRRGARPLAFPDDAEAKDGSRHKALAAAPWP
jgi:hypothetical protein